MDAFDWQCHPEAEAWLHSLIDGYLEKNPQIARLAENLREKTSTRLFDWIDHLTIDSSSSAEKELIAFGFAQETTMPTYRVFTHPGAKFPSILVRDISTKHPLGIAIKVESIGQYLMVRGMEGCIEGSPLSPYRRCLVSQEQTVALLVIERRGSRTMEPFYAPEPYLDDYLSAKERWQGRLRDTDDEDDAFRQALKLAEEMVSTLGKDVSAWIVLECEREYWQSRNNAAQIQKNRQDSMGMGWANHDHHTFRSSRKHFSSLVRLFEILGFHCRERYHAGEKAGWGAQIMESEATGLILFLDVDLGTEELTFDFSHHPMHERSSVSTVGLWCALHGDSILKGGMHHLEAQFDFDRLSQDLSTEGISMMKPFSDFSYLRQAFTKGQLWTVSPHRIEKLLSKGLITPTQAEQFLKEGAIGSHLENLERKEGYKGFNKENVSRVLQWTDPRMAAM